MLMGFGVKVKAATAASTVVRWIQLADFDANLHQT